MIAQLSLMLSVVAVPVASAQTGGAIAHLAQAQLFARRGWYADADQELRSGLILPDGQDNFELHWLAAQVAWELLDVERAWQMAARAAELAADDNTRLAASTLAESYAGTFGYVDISGPHEGLVSRLQIEPTSPIFDPELKRYVNRLSLTLRDRTALPLRVGLPAGSYRINGQDLTVIASQDSALDLTMGELGSRGFAALQVSRLELGMGVKLLVGADMGNQLPAATAQLSLTQPVGPVLLGLSVGGSLDGYSAARNQRVGPLPVWDVGLRIGHEFPLVGPLSLRPSIVYQIGFQPGIGLACTPAPTDGTTDGMTDGNPQGAFTCVAQDDPAELNAVPLAVLATGLAHRPGLEVSLDYREAGRTTALGTGVKLIVDEYLGSLPAQGQAQTQSGELVAWTTTDRRWTATGVQMLGTLSFAF